MVPAIKSSTIFADTSSPAERAGSFKTTCKDHMSGVFGKGMRESGENKMWAEQTMSEVSARLHAVALQWKFSLSYVPETWYIISITVNNAPKRFFFNL